MGTNLSVRPHRVTVPGISPGGPNSALLAAAIRSGPGLHEREQYGFHRSLSSVQVMTGIATRAECPKRIDRRSLTIASCALDIVIFPSKGECGRSAPALQSPQNGRDRAPNHPRAPRPLRSDSLNLHPKQKNSAAALGARPRPRRKCAGHPRPPRPLSQASLSLGHNKKTDAAASREQRDPAQVRRLSTKHPARLKRSLPQLVSVKKESKRLLSRSPRNGTE